MFLDLWLFRAGRENLPEDQGDNTHDKASKGNAHAMSVHRNFPPRDGARLIARFVAAKPRLTRHWPLRSLRRITAPWRNW